MVELTDAISQADLQRQLDVNQSRLSKLLAKLLREELLEADSDHDDRRLQVLKSSEQGRGFVRQFEPKLSEAELRELAGGQIELIG